MQNLLRKYNLEDKKFIAINPVALWETKLWSNEKFAHLADLINNKLQMKVVFTGSEKEPIEKITSLMTTESINLGGQTSLLELACLYKKAQNGDINRFRSHAFGRGGGNPGYRSFRANRSGKNRPLRCRPYSNQDRTALQSLFFKKMFDKKMHGRYFSRASFCRREKKLTKE